MSLKRQTYTVLGRHESVLRRQDKPTAQPLRWGSARDLSLWIETLPHPQAKIRFALFNGAQLYGDVALSSWSVALGK